LAFVFPPFVSIRPPERDNSANNQIKQSSSQADAQEISEAHLLDAVRDVLVVQEVSGLVVLVVTRRSVGLI